MGGFAVKGSSVAVVVGVATAAIGSLAFGWINKRSKAQAIAEEIIELTEEEQYRKIINDFALTLGKEGGEFKRLYNEFERDCQIETIPWIDRAHDYETKRDDNVKWMSFIIMGFREALEAMVRFNKGEKNPGFGICLQVSQDVVMESVDRITALHLGMQPRYLRHKANNLFSKINKNFQEEVA